MASQVGVDRKVAIKQLASEFASDPTFRQRFQAEARVLASFRHPNIVSIYDYVEAADGPYIVEELVVGSSLEAVVVKAGRLSPQQAVGVLRGALGGLAAVHERGLVHGAISLSNILVDRDGTSKLIDFGLASPALSFGQTQGSPYASPEALRGAPVDARSDVYAAGRVLQELLSGSPALPESEESGLDDQRLGVTSAGRQRLRLGDVVTSATATDPAERYADAAAFLAALEAAAQEDLGANWSSGASITALVATETLAGTGALLAAEAGADTGSGSATVATAAASGHASKIVSFTSGHPVYAAATAVAVVAAAVVAVVVSVGGTKPPNPLVGTYNVARVVTVGNGTILTGTADHFTETVACTGSACRFVGSTTWGTLSSAPDGIHAGGSVPNEPCGSDSPNPHGSYTLKAAIILHITGDASDAHGQKVTSHMTGVETLTAENNTCGGPAVPVTESLDLTRQ
jgi:hypothetical protein